MILTLLSHSVKESFRSHIFSKSLAIRLILIFLSVYLAANLIFLGFYLDELLTEFFPNTDPLQKFTGFLFYFYLFDIIIRSIIQKTPAVSATSYRHLPIKTRTIINYLLIRSGFNFFNILPLFTLIPFTIKVVLPSLGSAGGSIWLSTFILLTLSNNYTALYLKKVSDINLLKGGIIFILIASLILLDYKQVVPISTYFSRLIFKISSDGVLILIPVVLVVLSYVNVFSFLKKNIYLKEVSVSNEKNYSTRSENWAIERFGTIGELISLELKLIFRNKRPKSAVLMSFIFVAYGLIVYKNEEVADQTLALICMGILLTGMVMVNYGQFMMAWDSGYFDFLLSNRIDATDFFQAKYWLFVSANLISFILTTPYGFINTKIVLINFAMLLFNSGVNIFFLMYICTYNSKYINLERGALLNLEGTGAAQFLIIIPLFLVPILIFVPFAVFSVQDMAIYVLGTIGLTGILLKNYLLRTITKKFQTRRHIMASGFRQK